MVSVNIEPKTKELKMTTKKATTKKATTKKATTKKATKTATKKTTKTATKKTTKEAKILTINGNTHKVDNLQGFANLLFEYKRALGGEGVKNFAIFNVSQGKAILDDLTWDDLANGDIISISKQDSGA